MTNTIGSLVISIANKELTAEEREIIAHPLVGGVILFSRNYESRDQLKALCRDIRHARKKPVLIMADQEGGRVQRFKNEFTRLPPLALFGKIYDDDPVKATRLAREGGWLMAAELLTVGVDLSLAPVLDLNKGISTVIGDRAFHREPEVVIQLAKAFTKGMLEAGMAPTAKHFPGHGSIAPDSHLAIPVDDRSLSEIEQDDMIPFVAMINAGIKGMMPAHIIFPKVDNKTVGFSKVWLQDILRKKFAYQGVIFSDDLNMEGANISSRYADRVVAAKEAGCDFALLCNNHVGVIQVIDSLPCASYEVSVEKWGPLLGKYEAVAEPLDRNCKWQDIQEIFLTVAQKYTTN